MLAAGSGLSLAQTPLSGAQSNLQRQVDDAFRNVLQNPTDFAATGSYVDLLVRAGNYEGAIAALERLTVVPGAPPALRIQVAQLYGALKSFVMAEAMLQQVLAEPGLPAADKARAETLLGQVRSAGASSQFSGFVIFGVRQQNNATARTQSPQILSNGVLLPNTLSPQSDTDTSLGLRISHEYDLGLQNFAVLSSGGGVYFVNSNAASGKPIVAGFNTPYNLQVFDANSGVVFNPISSNRDLTIRPHLLGSTVQAQGASFLTSLGWGLDVNYRLGEVNGIYATLDSQRRNFATRADVPNAAQLNGTLTSLRLRSAYGVLPKQVLNTEVTFRDSSAGVGNFSFTSIEPRVSYGVSYAGPFGAGDWSTTPFVGLVQRSYKAADPAVIAGTARRDSEWRVGLTQTIPFAPRWMGLITLEQLRNSANLPNYNYKNTSVSANVIYSF
ncbi:MAG: hypothetical protein EAZ37_09125 [Burkholderiales bacterium]|nr:MAG: hypothetical protein EAZ37_09125 [Burkholderiales bacterium]